jgi:hypothetical protein
MPVHPGKERQQTVGFPLDLAEIVAKEPSDLGLGEVEAGQQRTRTE